jgi:hypothetical protein
MGEKLMEFCNTHLSAVEDLNKCKGLKDRNLKIYKKMHA